MGGWIKLYRDVQDHWIWKSDNRFKWWIDIILTVNHADTKVLIKGKLIECKRGQSVMSLETWGKRWNVSKKTVKDFFELLQKDSMLVYEGIQISTRITVCNYDIYQNEVNAKETKGKRKVNANVTDTLPKQEGEECKNDKKEKNKKEFTPPIILEVEQYFEEKGYKKESANRFFDFYSCNNWKDSNGKQVMNWKQKAISVWFKPENKTTEPVRPKNMTAKEYFESEK